MKDEDKTKERFSELVKIFPYNEKIEESQNKCRQAEEALRASENFYRNVFENTGIAKIVFEEDGTIILASKEFEKLTGYTRDELEGKKKWTEFVARRDELERMKKYNRLRRTDPLSAPQRYEFKLIDREGHFKDIVVNASVIPGRKQTMAALLDITDRKRMEAALKESERRLADIIDFLPDATFVIDLDGKVIAWNRAFEEMSGVKAKEILGKGNYEYALPFYGIRRPVLIDLAIGFTENIEKKYDFVRRKGNILLAETDVILKGSSRTLWGKAGPLYDSSGNVAGAIESVRDITELKRANETLRAEISERKHAESVLKESEEKYNQFFKTSRDCVFITSIEGKFIDLNDAAVELFGYASHEELMQVKVPDVYANPEDREKHNGLVAEYGYAKEFPVDFKRKDGSIRHALVTSVARYDVNANPIGFQGTIRDITERKLAAECLQKAHDELEIGVRERTAELTQTNEALQAEISERKHAESVRKESEEKFAELFLKSPIPMAITAMKDGRYVEVNESFVKVMDRTREELIGNTSTGAGFVTAEQRSLFLEEYRRKGYVENLELQMRVKDGRLRYGLFNASKITVDHENFFLTTATDITERKWVEAELTKYRDDLEALVSERTSELESRTKNLQEVNTALNVLLQKREEDRKILEERFVANIGRLVLPYVEKIRKNNLDAQQRFCLDIVEKHLGEIVSPLLKNIQQFNLTPREIQIASLIRDGKTTKEIARTLGIGKGSIDTHRKNIRKKLGLSRASNLQSRLRFLEK